ncbi:MAG: ATP-dependent Clp protease adaptor ClpS [Saprospiraceae bacterium]|jgi:ATP-dependent Clp protease adaptor protein ClpS|nr:ATP-dependent Clp protease adaptor ClpS [Saprospiraceae bacterium]MBP6397678.1 ATP-dependent Clp protease adaptor ClpS [Saprospiraceae bacterium]MBP9194390.1 ATP-dependent Clp protease adaptor ClpS [Saprospiraceae bacterium]
MNPHHSHKFEESEEQLVLDQTTEGTVAYLIIYNDDHNTFDWVIQCLMDVCNHTHEQSEQLSLIIHFKGKATVKTGPFDSLKPMKDALLDRGLSAVIETEVESR